MRLELPPLGIEVGPCGLFMSSGKGTHPDRVLNDYELIVVRKGTLSLWENDVRFDVPPGHALILYPHRRHRGATAFARDLSFYWIHWVFTPVSPGRVLEVAQFLKLERPEYVAELFHRLLDDKESQASDPYYAGLMLWQILLEVGRTAAEPAVRRGSVLAGRAEAYITNHLADRLSTARVARALRINPDYLNRVFREVHDDDPVSASSSSGRRGQAPPRDDRLRGGGRLGLRLLQRGALPPDVRATERTCPARIPPAPRPGLRERPVTPRPPP